MDEPTQTHLVDITYTYLDALLKNIPINGGKLLWDGLSTTQLSKVSAVAGLLAPMVSDISVLVGAYAVSNITGGNQLARATLMAGIDLSIKKLDVALTTHKL